MSRKYKRDFESRKRKQRKKTTTTKKKSVSENYLTNDKIHIVLVFVSRSSL